MIGAVADAPVPVLRGSASAVPALEGVRVVLPAARALPAKAANLGTGLERLQPGGLQPSITLESESAVERLTLDSMGVQPSASKNPEGALLPGKEGKVPADPPHRRKRWLRRGRAQGWTPMYCRDAPWVSARDSVVVL